MGLSGFRKGFKVLISHRYRSEFSIVNTSNKKGYGIYDYKPTSLDTHSNPESVISQSWD
jgi:hypothetical protein